MRHTSPFRVPTRVPDAPCTTDSPVTRPARRLVVGATAAALLMTLAGAGQSATAAAPVDPWSKSAVLVDDEFSRTLAKGLGTAPTGGAYSIKDTATYKVAGGRATVGPVKPGVSTATELTSAKAADVEVTAEVVLPTVGASSFSTYQGVQLRRAADGSAYRARLVVNAGGRSFVNIERVNGSKATSLAHVLLPTTVTAGATTLLDARVTGTNPVTVEARAWAKGTATPGWQAKATDSSAQRITGAGAVGTWTYTSGTSTAVTSQIDRITAWSLGKVTAPVANPAPEVPPAPPTNPAPPTVPPTPEVDPTFTIAVIPDTQQDVFSTRISNRAQWLVANRDALDLEFVLHTGDVVNWDTPTHDQFVDASKQLKPLDDAKVPTTLAIGNHDTFAVGVGGSARDARYTRQYVRDTTAFNTYFPATRYGVEGTFEPNKIDNNYQLFSAGGEDWMILTLELWPRAEAVEWAKKVVAQHADRNVIVMTHSYLEGNGTISTSAGYGATSPKSLYDTLISKYPNIRMVFSGHVGAGTSRTDTGVNGNKIVSYLGAYHSNTANPIRLVEIDTQNDTINTRVYSPNNNQTITGNQKITGLNFQ